MNSLNDNSVMKKLKKTLDMCALPQMLLMRLFTAFFMVSGIMLTTVDRELINPLYLNENNYQPPYAGNKAYIEQVDFALVILYTVIIMLGLTLLYVLLPKKFKVFDPFCTVFAVLYFDWTLLYGSETHRLSFTSDAAKNPNLYGAIGVALVTIVIVAYAVSKIKSMSFFENRQWWIYTAVALVAAVVMILYISVCSICNHRMFRTGAVDFGLFVQSFNSLADNLTAVNSCERDVLMSHFNIHASYIFYLVLPIFKIFPFEETLFVLQAIGAMAGIVPLMLILKRRNFKGLSMLAMGLGYVLSISLIAPCFYDFHENAFLPTLLMWVLWAADTKRYIPFYIFSALTCIVKEDAPLFIICIGLYVFFEQKGDKNRFHGLIATFVSCAYMLFITAWLTENGDGQNMTWWRFGHLMLVYEQSMVDVLINALRNPGYLFSTLVTAATLPFLVQVMLPLLFTPFFTKKIHRFLLMVPFILTNLVIGAHYKYAGEIGYQYIFGPATLLIFMSVINVDDMSSSTRRNIPILVFAASVVFYAGYGSFGSNYYTDYQENKAYYTQMDDALDRIPEDAVIAGNSVYIAHLCDRKEVYIFDTGDLTADQTAMLEPGRFDFIVLSRSDSTYRNAITAAGYTVWSSAGAIDIYVSPSYINVSN